MTRSPLLRLLAGLLRTPAVVALLVVGVVIATLVFIVLPADSDSTPPHPDVRGTTIAAPTDTGPLEPSPPPTIGAEQLALVGPTPTPRVIALPSPTAAPEAPVPIEIPSPTQAPPTLEPQPLSTDAANAQEAPAAVLLGEVLPTLTEPPSDGAGAAPAAEAPAPTAEPTKTPAIDGSDSDRAARDGGQGGNEKTSRADPGGQGKGNGKAKGKGKNGGKHKRGKGKR